MIMNTYKTMSMSFAYHNEMSTYPFWTKPYSRLVDVNIANSMLYATFEEPSEPMEPTKQFTLMLVPIGTTLPYEQKFHSTVKKSHVIMHNRVSGNSINIEADLIETLYQVYYTETRPQEEIRDERIEEVLE